MRQGTKFKFKNDYLFKSSVGDIENIGNRELEITGVNDVFYYCTDQSGTTYLLTNLNKQLSKVEFIR